MYILQHSQDSLYFNGKTVIRDEFDSFEKALEYAKRTFVSLYDEDAIIINTEATNEYSKQFKLSKFIS